MSLLDQTSESLCVACHVRGSVGGRWGREHLARSAAHNEVPNGANSNQATIVRCVLTATLHSSGLRAQWQAASERQDRDVEGDSKGALLAPEGSLVLDDPARPWVQAGAERSSVWASIPGLPEKRLHTGTALYEALGHARDIVGLIGFIVN